MYMLMKVGLTCRLHWPNAEKPSYYSACICVRWLFAGWKTFLKWGLAANQTKSGPARIQGSPFRDSFGMNKENLRV